MNVQTHAARLRAAIPTCLLACTALLVTGCGGDDGTKVSAAAATPTDSPTTTASPTGSPSPSDTATRLTDDQAERQALVPATKVTWDKAADTAVGEVSGSKLIEIELAKYESGATASPAPSPGSPQWVVDVATNDGTVQTVHVDAVSGTVLQSQPAPDQDAEAKQEVTGRLTDAKVTADQAVKTATDKKQGTVTAVQLDDDDANKLVWSVDVVDQKDWSQTSFDVDAVNGQILRETVDTD
jgi:uncharacterized membrane protein YkoI